MTNLSPADQIELDGIKLQKGRISLNGARYGVEFRFWRDGKDVTASVNVNELSSALEHADLKQLRDKLNELELG